MRILVAEDEIKLNETVAAHLKGAGYAVDACLNGIDALDYVRAGSYNAVVMDVMMPGLTGLEVLERMRNAGDKTPVLLLTALGSVLDRVKGLDAGADDYLVKPFALSELSARVRALVRRTSAAPSAVLRCGDLAMDVAAHTVRRGDREIMLSAREFSILEYMLHNKGIVLTREQIEAHTWNFDYAGGSNIVDVYIRYLRKKVDAGFEVKLLHTVRGSGYTIREAAPCTHP